VATGLVDSRTTNSGANKILCRVNKMRPGGLGPVRSTKPAYLRVGRRSLMLFGCAGIALSHLVLGLTYRAGIKGLPVLLITLCTIGCYALSLSPVTWVLISEIFPNRVRGIGSRFRCLLSGVLPLF
jgi:SP family xylose:H+ symportor-like MFS transporter